MEPMFPTTSLFHLVLGGFLLLIGFQLFRAFGEWQSNNQADRLVLPARLVTKRQEFRGGGADSQAVTFYYATFEFADKGRLELRVKGEVYGQLAEGDQGTLTYQGTRFVDFQRD